MKWSSGLGTSLQRKTNIQNKFVFTFYRVQLLFGLEYFKLKLPIQKIPLKIFVFKTSKWTF